MAQYQVWALNDNYTKAALIKHYSYLEYLIAINRMGWATLGLLPNDPKIEELELMRRLLIIRDGLAVYGGLLLREGWKIPKTAPRGVTFTFHSIDYAWYAYKREVVPPEGYEYDERTGPVDDLAKGYTYDHAGAGAGVDRDWGDLTVQANAGQAASHTEKARFGKLIKLYDKLRGKAPFDWRFVPGVTGVEFRTKAPHWGVDRRRGNGSNDECIFSLDRRNFEAMSYTRDLIEMDSQVWVGGQGEGINRTIVERTDTTRIAAYKRREAFYDARRFELEASLQAEGDAYLAGHGPEETMTVVPRRGTWRATSGTTWDLGDLVTADVNLYGRQFVQDMKVMAIKVRLDRRRREAVEPELEAIA